MTVAVCVYCSALKHGAFVPCPSCERSPEGQEDIANSFAMTDHHFEMDELRQWAAWRTGDDVSSIPAALIAKAFLTYTQIVNSELIKVAVGYMQSDHSDSPIDRSSYDVLLLSPGDDRLGVMKTIRRLAEFDLKEAKAFIDGPETVLAADCNKQAAEYMKTTLEQFGATVALRLREDTPEE